MEFSSTQGNRRINLISGRKEGRIAWKSQDSFLLINSNPLPSSAWRWKSITTAVMMVHYQFHWLCIITVSHFFVHENLSCSLFVFYFGHRLKFPLLFSQQVVFSATFCLSSLFTALQVKTDLGAVLICIAVLSLWYQKHLCESETLRARAEHWWLSLSESKYSPGWCYLRTTPGAFDHDDIWVTRHVAHHSSHSTCTVYIHGCGTIGVKAATVVGTVSPVCLLCLTSAVESAEESFREP